MKIVFMGTPAFAAQFLEHLVASDNEVLAVVTQPDRPAGRGRVLTPPPVKEAALKHNLPVLQPTDLKSPEFEADLRKYDADLYVVVAYSILPKNILGITKFGAVNVHGSLRCRSGAACYCRWPQGNGRDRFPPGRKDGPRSDSCTAHCRD